MTNRRERRRQTKWLQFRLTILKNSKLLKDADLSDIPKETIDALAGHTCENKDLQRRYDKSLKIMDEIMQIQISLNNLEADLEQKQKQKQILDAAKKNIRNINKT